MTLGPNGLIFGSDSVRVLMLLLLFLILMTKGVLFLVVVGILRVRFLKDLTCKESYISGTIFAKVQSFEAGLLCEPLFTQHCTTFFCAEQFSSLDIYIM